MSLFSDEFECVFPCDLGGVGVPVHQGLLGIAEEHDSVQIERGDAIRGEFDEGAVLVLASPAAGVPSDACRDPISIAVRNSRSSNGFSTNPNGSMVLARRRVASSEYALAKTIGMSSSCEDRLRRIDPIQCPLQPDIHQDQIRMVTEHLGECLVAASRQLPVIVYPISSRRRRTSSATITSSSTIRIDGETR